MAAAQGNQFWKARAKHGRGKIFSSKKILWNACCEYFQWVEDNPLQKAIVYQGMVTGSESLLRAMTLSGLCIFLGVNSAYFTDFKDNLDLETEEGQGFSQVIKDVYEIIKTQKFEGASAGLLNANIIARDLGLTDNQKVEATGTFDHSHRAISETDSFVRSVITGGQVEPLQESSED